MLNSLQLPKTEENSNENLSPDAQKLLAILDELQDFTNNLRKKLIAELRPESDSSSAHKSN